MESKSQQYINEMEKNAKLFEEKLNKFKKYQTSEAYTQQDDYEEKEEDFRQENRRIQYSLNGVEIDIDSWPMIPTYLEIEGASEEDVYKTIELLGFTKEDCTTKDVQQIYLDYGYDLDKISELKFGDNE